MSQKKSRYCVRMLTWVQHHARTRTQGRQPPDRPVATVQARRRRGRIRQGLRHQGQQACLATSGGRIPAQWPQSDYTSIPRQVNILQESGVRFALHLSCRIILNLATSAYEITHVHKREPPPKSILEDVSAKGGDLLTRTVDNFFPPSSREIERRRNGEDDSEDDDEDGDAKGTPKDDKMDVDEPGSVGRSTRCMLHHQAPSAASANKLLQPSAMRPLSASSSSPKSRPARRASPRVTRARRKSTAMAPAPQP